MRALIVNCDDLGMSRAVNLGVIEAIEEGIARSCSLMPPCPAAPHALDLLRERPHIPFGIHLTLIRDAVPEGWGPLSPKERVTSLLNPAGDLFAPDQVPALLAQARADEVEAEFRTQIETVLDSGLQPTHLDWHCLADGGREDLFELTVALGTEYGLSVRAWFEPGRDALRRRGLPVTDRDFLDSFRLGVDGRDDRYAELLRALPDGLTEWAVHPALRDTGDPGWRVRHGDHAFLTSARARDLIEEEGIVLTDHRAFQRAWRDDQASSR